MMFYRDQFIQIKQLNAQKAKICHSFICGEMYNEKCIFLIQEPALFKGEICKCLKNCDFNILLDLECSKPVEHSLFYDILC